MSFLEKLIPWLSVTLVSMAPGVLNLILLRWGNPGWWKMRRVRHIAWRWPILGAVLIFIWLAGMRFASAEVDRFLAITFLIAYLPQLALVGALTLTSAIHFIERCLDARSKADPSRRLFLRRTTAAMPILAGGVCVSALVEASLPAKVYRRPLRFPDLPRALDGYRILHITDLHLAGFVTIGDLAGILERARPFEPDLLVITGDTIDNLHLLPEALERMADFGAPDGAFAVLGNHEHSVGAKQVTATFETSRVPLLQNQGRRLPVGDAMIFLGGIDDIRSVNHRIKAERFYAEHIATAFDEAQPDDFRLLLSHRPDAFDEACRRGIDLTLSGHTHGGQVVLFGHSAFPRRSAAPYMRGVATRGHSKVFTSSGCGHWFPLRLGCPTEAPVIELVRG